MDRLRGDQFSPADEDDSGAVGMVCVLLVFIVAAVVTLAASLLNTASAAEKATEKADRALEVVYDKPAEEDGMTVSGARTDGPIYDLPDDVGQQIVCDSYNREYILLTTAQGGVFLMPYLDEDGNQAIMPQA